MQKPYVQDIWPTCFFPHGGIVVYVPGGSVEHIFLQETATTGPPQLWAPGVHPITEAALGDGVSVPITEAVLCDGVRAPRLPFF